MRKRLGQHFLEDKSVLKKIAGLLEINSSDVIVEVGPGHGELTLEIKNQISHAHRQAGHAYRQAGKIKNNSVKIITIEKDKELAKDLKFRIQDSGLKNIKIVEGDALKIIPTLSNKLKTINYKLVGNIPYYITGYLLRILGELGNKPSLIVLTVQKEVAERICAKPPKMNLLAASVQFWAKPEIVGFISRKSFSPPPEVDSAIIKLIPKFNIPSADWRTKFYYQFIRILFKQPRKTILNNLSDGMKISKEEVRKKLVAQGIEPGARPQNLAIDKIIILSTEFFIKKW